MTTVLFIRPSHDDVTSYLFHYSKQLVSEAEAKGFNTLNKEKEKTTKKIITKIIKKNNPSFIMFNGHGNPNIIVGHQNEPLITCGENSCVNMVISM